jgi:hypothetical protein
MERFLSLTNEEKKQRALWYKVRWCFYESLGDPAKLEACFELAASCSLLDARWLLHIFADEDMSQPAEALPGQSRSLVNRTDQVLSVLSREQTDPRALCFLGIMENKPDLVTLAADQGVPFALVAKAFPRLYNCCAQESQLEHEEKLQLLKRAAAAGEPDAIHYMSKYGNLDDKETFIKLAAELGSSRAMQDMESISREKSDFVNMWFWRLQLMQNAGRTKRYLDELIQCARDFFEKKLFLLAPVVFLLGEFMAHNDKIDFKEQSVFCFRKAHSDFACAVMMRDFFEAQCAAARKAALTWCWMAPKIDSRINPAICKVIGMMIMNARSRAEYQIGDIKPMSEREKRARKRHLNK